MRAAPARRRSHDRLQHPPHFSSQKLGRPRAGPSCLRSKCCPAEKLSLRLLFGIGSTSIPLELQSVSGGHVVSGFTKLDSGIVHSTIWVQPHDVLRVWIALLALADRNGMVHTAAPALAHLSLIPLDRMREILQILESPDEDSRSEAEGGRRILKIEGGWWLVNHSEYRRRVSADEKREADRARIAARRGGSRVDLPHVANCRKASRLVQDVAEVAQAEAEAEADTDAATKAKKAQMRLRGTRLSRNWNLPTAWKEWARNERQDLHIESEAAKFADYWHAKVGTDGYKTDWQTAWRNWIRNAYRGAGLGERARRESLIEQSARLNRQADFEEECHEGAIALTR